MLGHGKNSRVTEGEAFTAPYTMIVSAVTIVRARSHHEHALTIETERLRHDPQRALYACTCCAELDATTFCKKLCSATWK